MAGSPDDYLQSQAFVYNGVSDSCKGGTSIPSNIEWMAEHGSIGVSTMRFNDRLCEDPLAYAPGSNFSDPQVEKISRSPSEALNEIKASIAAGDPVISLIKDCREFKTAWGRSYIPAVDTSEDGKCGYHSVLLVGYDDDARAIRILNSWGPDWGSHGKVWMDYDAFKARYKEGYVDAKPAAHLRRVSRGGEIDASSAEGRPEDGEVTALVLEQAIRSNVGKVLRTETNHDGRKVEWREWNLWLDLPKRYLDQIESAEYVLHDDTFPRAFKVKKTSSSLLMTTWSGYDCVDAGTVRVLLRGKPSVFGNFDHCKLEQTQKPLE